MGQAFPLIAALALTGGGAAMNAAGANKVKKRTEGFINAETARQRQNVNQGWDTFTKSLAGEGATGATQAIEQGAAHRAGLASDIPSATYDTTKEPLMKGPGTVSPGSDLGREIAARHRLGGLSEMQLRDMIRNLDTQTQLNVISRRAQNSANILPYELQEAQYAGDNLRNIGGVMSGLGSILGMYGAFSGLGAPAAAASGTSTGTSALGNTAAAASAFPALQPWSWQPPVNQNAPMYNWESTLKQRPVGLTHTYLS